MNTLNSRLPLWGNSLLALKTWWPVLLGLAVLYAPTYWMLAHGLWNSEEQAHGPIVLIVALFLIWQKRDIFLIDVSGQTTGLTISGGATKAATAVRPLRFYHLSAQRPGQAGPGQARPGSGGGPPPCPRPCRRPGCRRPPPRAGGPCRHPDPRRPNGVPQSPAPGPG